MATLHNVVVENDLGRKIKLRFF